MRGEEQGLSPALDVAEAGIAQLVELLIEGAGDGLLRQDASSDLFDLAVMDCGHGRGCWELQVREVGAEVDRGRAAGVRLTAGIPGVGELGDVLNRQRAAGVLTGAAGLDQRDVGDRGRPAGGFISAVAAVGGPGSGGGDHRR